MTINTTQIRNMLGEDVNKVLHPAQSPLVNKWSRYKPVRGDRDYDFGFDTLSGTLYAPPANAWGYLQPRGLAYNEGGRMGDFRGYNHAAVPPAINEYYQSDDTYSFASFYPPDMPLTAADFVMTDILGINDWDEWHFGVMLEGDGYIIYSVNSQDIKPRTPEVVTVGTTFQFSNTKFNGFPAVHTYNYICFITPDYEPDLDLILRGDLDGTQQLQHIIVLPNGYGSFERVAPPPAPAEPEFRLGIIPMGFSVTGTVTRGETHAHYTITNSTGSAQNVDVTLTVTKAGVVQYDPMVNDITSESGVNAERSIAIFKGALAGYDQVFTIAIT